MNMLISVVLLLACVSLASSQRDSEAQISPNKLDPCSYTLCAPNTTCRNVDGQAQCESVCPEQDPDSRPSGVCNLLCTVGSVCRIVDGRPSCVPESEEQDCDTEAKPNPRNCEPVSPDQGPNTGPSEPKPNPCTWTKCGWGATCRNVDGQAVCECPSICPLYYSPLCCSDGKTYGNTCFLKVSNCKNKTSVTVVHPGEC